MKRESEESTMKLTNLMAWVAAAVVVFAGGGCASQSSSGRSGQEEANSDLFPKEPETTVARFGDVQTSNGSRYDANLYPHHFNGGHLNSLGRAKVLLMLQDCETCEPIVVHLVDAGEGDLYDQRKQAVELYLKTAEGVNTRTMHPVAPTMARAMKAESGTIEGSGGAAGGDGGSMMGGSILSGGAGK